LHVVAAIPRRVPAPPEVPEEFRYTVVAAGTGDWVLCQAKAQAASANVKVTTHPVRADPADAIALVAREESADLIVVGCGSGHGDRRLSDVDKTVMDQAGCAVLVV
jgi:nucleotide-binding universal stress UspA family protein